MQGRKTGCFPPKEGGEGESTELEWDRGSTWERCRKGRAKKEVLSRLNAEENERWGGRKREGETEGGESETSIWKKWSLQTCVGGFREHTGPPTQAWYLLPPRARPEPSNCTPGSFLGVRAKREVEENGK